MMNTKHFLYKITILLVVVLNLNSLLASTPDDALNCKQVNTFTNPVLPGDHPDPTLFQFGKDFYHCGSTFHFNPYMPIYHSTDLVHWEVIARVLPPTRAGWVSDRPSGGIWQGAITYFYGSWWIYFSAGGQWFCKADSPYGPWSDPVEVKTNPESGPLGYDNSIFVDDDGRPYMVIKNMQHVNRIQELGRDGQLTGKIMNLDWINAKNQYSWAEGPVMCKRNGYYYYFPAGDVSGGQYVLRSRELTADSTKWERLGEFFKPITDAKVGFRRPNHMAAPLMLADGTWWTIAQSYEKYEGDDWYGTGRQTSLYPVIWEGDRPWGMAPTTQPIAKPNLPSSGIHWRSVTSDNFDQPTMALCWHFLDKKCYSKCSLTDRKGWVRLHVDTARTHLVQKETDHYYTAITRLDFDAQKANEKAGLYLTSGNQQVIVQLYTGLEDGVKKIVMQHGSVRQAIANSFGNTLYLKITRVAHQLTGYVSGDGRKWIALGLPVDVKNLDKEQPNYNSWVGTSVGLFAEGKSADFDRFICKDAYTELPAIGYSNYYAVEKVNTPAGSGVTNTSINGGWFMISGVDFGENTVKGIDVELTSGTKSILEIRIDDLKDGKLIAKIPVSALQKSPMKHYIQQVAKISGQHDVFVKFSPNAKGKVIVKSIRFTK
jgi:beta-xylosidase